MSPNPRPSDIRFPAEVLNKLNKFVLKRNTGEVLNKLMSRDFRAASISIYDFSILSTTLPHNLIKEKLLDLIVRTFQRE